MTDIVDDLKRYAARSIHPATMLDAAAEIERLRSALGAIAATTYGYEPSAMSDEEAVKYFSGLFFGAQKTARAALAQGGDK